MASRSAKVTAPAPRSTAATPLSNAPSAALTAADNRPAAVAQRRLQTLADNSPRVQQAAQLQAHADTGAAPVPQKANRTGLPDELKAGVESLSGHSLDEVRVHYNSSQPAQLQAHAYAQGTDIHLAPGQEQHLPHEAWHVVQQQQGRVQPTRQLPNEVAVNDDAGLEREADVMGARALGPTAAATRTGPVQRQILPRQLMRAAPEATAASAVLAKEPGWTLEAVGSARPAPAAASGLPVQCVGGKKFGLQVTGATDNVTVAEGLVRLKQVQADYKREIKEAKQAAALTFSGGDQADVTRQTEYSTALAAAEMTPEGLIDKLAGGLTVDNDIISYQGQEVARIRRGAAAYHVSTPAAGGVAAVYKRHTLNGPSANEFVDVGGEKLRRYAWRGITPPERAAFRANTPLRPMNSGRETQGQIGYNFDDRTGRPIERTRSGTSVTDLEWLNSHAGTALGAVPMDQRLLAFMQTRKGVGKLLSATSTPKPITSNHGASFAGYGRIKVDLARVPTINITHHYKQPAFTAGALSTTVGRPGNIHHRLDWETNRANETVLRNRELLLSEIPSAAVAELQDTPERQAYEQEFSRLYTSKFKELYRQVVQNSELDFGAIVAPDPAVIPYREDHYSIVQARTDIDVPTITEEARVAAQPLLEYGEAYNTSYADGWTAGYEDAAWESTYVATHAADVTAINVPEAPDPGSIPTGAGRRAGQNDGRAAGNTAGKLEGTNYSG
ncbi:eCIS core domain-containing protein [Hymenobacter chitinivorans]|uniref:Uncharacterized protein DUF4157 n=1 Tax=Hymenobacter chitinivorans DSM 11115 TaxID=1121954 RepID=A0A2M9BTD2_9BACT|nr:DUF4157 domain-containing protein [Hymenobacter chitinivorans]PJJ61209.1 uncharacterized protein DUF4157 [Hymenobacter chitinivorans DSM 11115]